MDSDVRRQGVFRGAERPDMDMMDSPDILDSEYFSLETLIQAGSFDPYSSRTVFDVEPLGYLANA